jgi:FkbM family methyltransferase
MRKALWGIGLIRSQVLAQLQKTNSYHSIARWTKGASSKNPMVDFVLENFSESFAQLQQDLVALWLKNKIFGKESQGYFVEFGATNGIDLSNSYLVETEFSWTGILAEPARVWEKELRLNRANSVIETLCVWKESDSWLTFNETDEPELSTVDSFSDKDSHSNTRQAGKKYEVLTISLNDLLRKHQAPKYIDYLSIDTEGSEFEILNAFNFDEFSIGIITVEHNYTPQRELIFALLTSHGYKRKHENISAWDDWYVKI